MTGADDLRNAYRDTYREYASKLDSLQRIRDSKCADTDAVETAIAGLEKARVAYNTARDRLARRLDGKFDAGLRNELVSAEQRVSAAARLLWELSGRPEGTAESDWKRAEMLVHAASD